MRVRRLAALVAVPALVALSPRPVLADSGAGVTGGGCCPGCPYCFWS